MSISQERLRLLGHLQRAAVQRGRVRGLHVHLHGASHGDRVRGVPLVPQRSAIGRHVQRGGAYSAVWLVLLAHSGVGLVHIHIRLVHL